MDISKRKKARMRQAFITFSLFAGALAAPLAFADFKALDDESMSAVTGQAGLTLEIDFELSISELAYKDQGYLAFEDFKWGGADRTGGVGATGRFENWKMELDVAGPSESLAYGFSALDNYYAGLSAPDAGWDAAILANDDAYEAGDGDLVIHNTSKNLFDGTKYDFGSDSDVALSGGPTSQPSNNFTDAIDDWRNSAPFAIEIGAVKLHDSGYGIGSKAGGLTLMSNFKAEVLTGPLDIIITNGSGYTNGVSNGKILISDYFEISDLSVDFDFIGASMEGVRFHNRRGDTTGLNVNRGADGVLGTADDVATESFGFAHAKLEIAGLEDASKGLHIAGGIKGDLDIDHLSLDPARISIGSIYVTDMTVEASLNIRGH